MEIKQDRSRVHVIIRGRVQGVYFRASAVEEARRMGLSGWITNCADGSVEVVAEGARANLERLIAWCHHGPPGARVEAVHTEWKPAQDEFLSFRLKR